MECQRCQHENRNEAQFCSDMIKSGIIPMPSSMGKTRGHCA